MLAKENYFPIRNYVAEEEEDEEEEDEEDEEDEDFNSDVESVREVHGSYKILMRFAH